MYLCKKKNKGWYVLIRIFNLCNIDIHISLDNPVNVWLFYRDVASPLEIVKEGLNQFLVGDRVVIVALLLFLRKIWIDIVKIYVFDQEAR